MIYATLRQKGLTISGDDKLQKDYDKELDKLTKDTLKEIEDLEKEINKANTGKLKRKLMEAEDTHFDTIEFYSKQFLADNNFLPISEEFYYKQ